MADYDSDSSIEDSNDVSTNVLLGYASKEPTSDNFSQVGGLPVWLDSGFTPDGRLGKCKVCSSVLCLLLQLNADLPDWFPGHERRVYVLGCRRKACRRKDGSVRSIRAVRAYEFESTNAQGASQTSAHEEQRPAANIGETLFGVKSPTPGQANPFSTNSSTISSATNPFASASTASNSSSQNVATIQSQPATNSTLTSADSLAQTFAQKARIASSEPSNAPPSAPEPWSTDPKPYTRYHLDAETEYLDPTILSSDVPSNARVEANGEGSSAADDDKVLFESTMDKTFQRFADRLAQNPEQVLRYEFGGHPLLYSKSDAVGKLLAPAVGEGATVQTSSSKSGGGLSKVPRCGNCGAGRVFEMQLTPHAITELEADDPAIDGMEWGTIIVGVCSEDCQEKGKSVGEVGYLEEWVGVQWEEIADHRPR